MFPRGTIYKPYHIKCRTLAELTAAFVSTFHQLWTIYQFAYEQNNCGNCKATDIKHEHTNCKNDQTQRSYKHRWQTCITVVLQSCKTFPNFRRCHAVFAQRTLSKFTTSYIHCCIKIRPKWPNENRRAPINEKIPVFHIKWIERFKIWSWPFLAVINIHFDELHCFS